MDLIENGLEIQYREITRNVKDYKTGENDEQTIMTDFYLEREFSDCELRLLIDELLDTKYIPYHQRKQLVSKLEGLSSIYFRKRKDLAEKTDSNGENPQLFYTLGIIEEAIALHSKVEFRYKNFIAGKNGKVEVWYDSYTVTPHDMKVRNGAYLLTCSGNGIEEKTLRIDYVTDICILNESGQRRSYSCRDEQKKEKNIKFLASEEDLSVFVEEFGKESIIIENDNGRENLILAIKTYEEKAVKFGIIHSDIGTVISPINVRKAVMNQLRSGVEKYETL